MRVRVQASQPSHVASTSRPRRASAAAEARGRRLEPHTLYPRRVMQTRYLLIASAITALVILVAAAVWLTLTFA